MKPFTISDDVMQNLIDAEWFDKRKVKLQWVAVPNPKFFTDKMPVMVWDWGNRDWEPGCSVGELPND